jgi:DNA-binding XRE family transcriptional regulator
MRNEFKDAREARGHTQREVADLIGVPYRTYQAWEQGQDRYRQDLTLYLELYVLKTDVRSAVEALIENCLDEPHDVREHVGVFINALPDLGLAVDL